MATTPDERLTIAPIVGPDDPRRFTDSGIEIEELYDERDLPGELRLGEPGDFPYTRGVHREMYREQQWTMRQYAGYASAKETNERYRYLLSRGGDRPVDGLRPADAARPGLRRPALPGRGRAHRRRDRHDRRHADRVRRDPARPGLDVDDDQRARGGPADALRPRRRGAGRAEREAARDDPERRAQGVHRPRQLHLPAGADDAADDRHLRVLRRAHPEVEHDLDLRLPLPREGLLGGAGGRVHAVQRASPTCRRPSTAACRSTTSPRAWRSSSTGTTTSSRRSRSSARRAACGRRSCASASARRTRRR